MGISKKYFFKCRGCLPIYFKIVIINQKLKLAGNEQNFLASIVLVDGISNQFLSILRFSSNSFFKGFPVLVVLVLVLFIHFDHLNNFDPLNHFDHFNLMDPFEYLDCFDNLNDLIRFNEFDNIYHSGLFSQFDHF